METRTKNVHRYEFAMHLEIIGIAHNDIHSAMASQSVTANPRLSASKLNNSCNHNPKLPYNIPQTVTHVIVAAMRNTTVIFENSNLKSENNSDLIALSVLLFRVVALVLFMIDSISIKSFNEMAGTLQNNNKLSGI